MMESANSFFGGIHHPTLTPYQTFSGSNPHAGSGMMFGGFPGNTGMIPSGGPGPSGGNFSSFSSDVISRRSFVPHHGSLGIGGSGSSAGGPGTFFNGWSPGYGNGMAGNFMNMNSSGTTHMGLLQGSDPVIPPPTSPLQQQQHAPSQQLRMSNPGSSSSSCNSSNNNNNSVLNNNNNNLIISSSSSSPQLLHSHYSPLQSNHQHQQQQQQQQQQQTSICSGFSPYGSPLHGSGLASPGSVLNNSSGSALPGLSNSSNLKPTLGYGPFSSSDLLGSPPHAPFAPTHHHPLNQLSNLYVGDMYHAHHHHHPVNGHPHHPQPALSGIPPATGRLFSSELASLPLPSRLDGGPMTYLNDISSQTAAGYLSGKSDLAVWCCCYS